MEREVGRVRAKVEGDDSEANAEDDSRAQAEDDSGANADDDSGAEGSSSQSFRYS